MIKGILFDKDGTLLDFNRTWLRPYQQATSYLAHSVGQPALASTLMQTGGYIEATGRWVADSLLASGSNQQILEHWAQQLGQPLDRQRRDVINKIFADAASHYDPVLDDMAGFFRQLRDRNLILGLATMDDEANARGMLQILRLSGFFDFVCGADSGYGVKPDPGMVFAFGQHCNLPPSEIIMVGDSPKDLKMGRNAQVALSLGVLTGAHGPAELAPHADRVLDNIEGLIDLLDVT